MKDYFAITISDFSGSHYYRIKKSAKQRLMYMLLLVLLVISASISYNYLQHKQAGTLHHKNAGLEREVSRLDYHNAKLSQDFVVHGQLAQDIDRELRIIERIGGMERAGRSALDQRIRAVGRFYNEKEEEYSEIGGRVEKIEWILNPRNIPRDGPPTLSARVDSAALSVHQETILHSSIPNGHPTASRVITSKFGKRIHPVTKVKTPHKGVDFRTKGRVKVYSTADGIVRSADFSKLSGNRVIVQHNFGFESYYAHLYNMSVKPGDIIHKGEQVGVSGNTGQSTAPHLHYEIRYLGKSINPSAFLHWEFGSQEIFTQVKEVKWQSLTNLINQQISHQTLQLSQLDPDSPEKSK